MPKTRKITPKQEKFVEEYVQSGNGVQSALIAYDTDKYNVAKTIACENMTKPYVVQAIDEKKRDLMQEFKDNAYRMYAVLIDVLENTNNQKLKVDIAKDLLNRAGYSPTEKREITGLLAGTNLDGNSRVAQEIATRARELLADMQKERTLDNEMQSKEL
jgi:phage terminase small subunit